MDIFTGLPQRTKILIVASSLFLITLSMGLLVFGTNVITEENSLFEKTREATRADMLYIHPMEEGAQAGEETVD